MRARRANAGPWGHDVSCETEVSVRGAVSILNSAMDSVPSRRTRNCDSLRRPVAHGRRRTGILLEPRRDLRRLIRLGHCAVTGVENRNSGIRTAAATTSYAKTRSTVPGSVARHPDSRHGYATARRALTGGACALMTDSERHPVPDALVTTLASLALAGCTGRGPRTLPTPDSAASQAVVAGESLPLVRRLLRHRRLRTMAGHAYLTDVHLVGAAAPVGSLSPRRWSAAEIDDCAP